MTVGSLSLHLSVFRPRLQMLWPYTMDNGIPQVGQQPQPPHPNPCSPAPGGSLGRLGSWPARTHRHATQHTRIISGIAATNSEGKYKC